MVPLQRRKVWNGSGSAADESLGARILGSKEFNERSPRPGMESELDLEALNRLPSDVMEEPVKASLAFREDGLRLDLELEPMTFWTQPDAPIAGKSGTVFTFLAGCTSPVAAHTGVAVGNEGLFGDRPLDSIWYTLARAVELSLKIFVRYLYAPICCSWSRTPSKLETGGRSSFR